MKWYYKSLIIMTAAILGLAGILYFSGITINAQQGRTVGRVFLYFVHTGKCAHAYSLTSEQFRSSRPYLLFCSDVYKIQRLSHGGFPFRASDEVLNENSVFLIGSSIINAWSAQSTLTYNTGVRAEESINVVYVREMYTVEKFYFVQQGGVWASNSSADYTLSEAEQKLIQDVELKIADTQSTESEFQRISQENFTEETLNVTNRIASALSQHIVPENVLNGEINESIQRVFSFQWDAVSVVGASMSRENNIDRISFIVLRKVTENEVEESFSLLLFFYNETLKNIMLLPGDFSGDNAYFYNTISVTMPDD